MKKEVDKWLLASIIALVVTGVFIFLSASLGLLAREGARFSSVVFSQFFGIFLGLIAMIVASKIPYQFWKKYSFYIFVLSILLTVLVFVPGFGFEHGGAKRWLSLGGFSFQPAEFLKIGFIFYFAAWLASFRKKVPMVSYGFVPFIVLMGLVGALLLKQPDTGTFMVILGTAFVMFFASGAPWRHILLLAGGSLLGLATLSYFRPYIKERIFTFLNPASDPLGAGYQIQQSLIAVGSGELFGRGFGQSVQKFGFLPEPVSDSIFAVFSEEFGIIGGIFLISLFIFFAIRGFRVARRAPNYFARLLGLGIVILIVGQAFLNIGSILGVFPLTGLPLPFISHGGTAIIFTFFSVGILLNISRYTKV